MFAFFKDQIDKFIFKIEDVCESQHFKVAFFGSDIENFFISNFEYAKFLDEYSYFDFSREVCIDTIIVVGNVNRKELDIILNAVKTKKINHSIYIPGPRAKTLNNRFYNSVQEIESLVDFDLVYNQYPVDLSNLTRKIGELKRGDSL